MFNVIISKRNHLKQPVIILLFINHSILTQLSIYYIDFILYLYL